MVMMPKRLEHLASRAARPDIKLRASGDTEREKTELETERDFLIHVRRDGYFEAEILGRRGRKSLVISYKQLQMFSRLTESLLKPLA